jgi:hypothetical protein
MSHNSSDLRVRRMQKLLREVTITQICGNPKVGLADRWWERLLKGKRTDIRSRRRQAHRVVKAFQILKDGRSGLCAADKVGTHHTLTFERVEERFHHSIVVTVSCAAHTDFNAQFGQERPIAQTGLLAAPIRMMEQTG